MENGHANHQIECLECELPTQERLNYFNGQFLTQRDFRDEQNYTIGKHRQHNRYLHGWGTVCGLKVVQHPNEACRDRFVIIEPGLALDCCGREIVVREKIYVDLVKALAPKYDEATETGKHLLISLCYAECKTEFVPALYSECGCTETGCDANRIYEGFEVDVDLVDELPQDRKTEPTSVRLEWTTTLTTDKAFRVAIDPKQERIYVLNAANPSQIMVYDTAHYCLLRSISIEGQGVDLAIASNGQFLYVLRYVETPSSGSGNYFLRVIQVKENSGQDLANPIIIKSSNNDDIPLNFGLSTNPPKLALGIKDNSEKVYTLDPITNTKKVIVWNSRINRPGANPNATAGNPDYPKDAEINVGNDPRAIAVSQDGAWLFIAEGAEKQIKAFKVASPMPPTLTFTISFTSAEKPELLAVTGDAGNNLRLYVVTISDSGDKKVRAFDIKEGTSSPFKEIGSGVAIGAGTPVAIAASTSGRWAYILLQDDNNNNKGSIRIVDGEKLAIDLTYKPSDPIPVVSNPRHLLFAPDGQKLYAAGEGAESACGGVSVLNVNEAQCKDLLSRALDGCPTCPEDNMCVPLAAVRDYQKDKSIKNIDNRRPLVPSTETLQKLILCALSTATGGKPEAGKDGKDGEGLERELTLIKALSWVHDANHSLLNNDDAPTIPIEDVPNDLAPFLEGIRTGLVIEFTQPVRVLKLKQGNFTNDNEKFQAIASEALIFATNVFQVWVEKKEDNGQDFLRCRCPIKGRVLPVKISLSNSDPNRIVKAVYDEKMTPLNNSFYLMASAIIFIPAEGSVGLFQNSEQVWVTLKGDFVVDKDGRAIDAEFVRGELPTGNHPRKINDSPTPIQQRIGIQGGLFESWWRNVRPDE